MIGIVAALVILLLMFRSVVAAGLPVAVAVAGLAVGLTGVTVLCGLMDVSPPPPRWRRWSGSASASTTRC